MNPLFEIFILTYNRLPYFKQMLQSVLDQTVKNIKITIVDNASTDGTDVFVKTLQQTHPRISYYKQLVHKPTFWGNLEKAQTLVSAKYVVFLHDDDLLHPQFVQVVLSLLEKYPDVDLISTLLSEFSHPSQIDNSPLTSVPYVLFKDKLAFATHIYTAFHVDNTSLCFPSVIYKTAYIKNLPIDVSLGGKAADKPFVLSSLHTGKCIQIRQRNLFHYRIHTGQDTQNTHTVNPTPEQIINHQLFFKSILSQTPTSKKAFYAFCREWVELFYRWGNNDMNPETVQNFYTQCLQQGVLDRLAFYSLMGPFRKLWRLLRMFQKTPFLKNLFTIKIHYLLLENIK